MTLVSEESLKVLKNKNFMFFLLYRFVLSAAAIMLSLVVSWQIYSLTKNVLLLGYMGLMELIPQISIALFAGYFIDLWDRKKILVYTTIGITIASAGLVLYSIPGFNLYSVLGIYPVFGIIVISGFMRGIQMPAHTALLGQIVDNDSMANAAAIGSASWQIAAVAGPAAGGMLYGFAGAVTAYSVIFALLFIACLLSLTLKIDRIKVTIKKEEGVFDSIKEGLKFVFHNQYLLSSFSLDMFAVLFGGAVAMLPVFASDVLHTGPEGLGILRSAPAIGAILMSFFLASHPPVKHSGKYLLYTVFGFGLSMIAFAFSRSFVVSMIVLMMSGAFDNVSVVIRGSILQIFTPNEIKGRIASVDSIFIGSSNELGAFESGLAANYMGLIPSVVFGGIMTLIVVTIVAIKAPKLRKMSLKTASSPRS